MHPLILALAATEAPGTFSNYQYEMLVRFFHIEKYQDIPTELRRLRLLRLGSTPTDVCKWRSVSCVDDRVQSFAYAYTQPSAHSMDADWLPPSLECVHLIDIIFVQAIQTSRLPRELLYFYLEDCGYIGHTIDLRSLPSKMHELHIIECVVGGTLDMTLLPQDMKIISLFGCGVSVVKVHNERLPEGLANVFITEEGTSCRILSPHKAKDVDERVQIVKYRGVFRSEYYFSCDLLLKAK